MLIENINLPAGKSGINYNFGETSGGSIQGVVFNDANNNGVQDGGETGIAGVEIKIFSGATAAGVQPQTPQLTDGNGAYSFANLPAGTYSLLETQPSGLLNGATVAGPAVTPGGTAGTATTSGSSMAAASARAMAT